MTTPKIDNEDIERLIDIIGDGDLTAEAQERLHQEGLWPLRACGKRPMPPLCSATEMGSQAWQAWP
jgi:hypothetical protein